MARAAELYPLPLTVLLERLERELNAGSEVFGVPQAAIWRPDPSRDLSTLHFGVPLGTPLGPAAGPHTQLAQNIVAGWLAGARFFELKTVQVLDDLELPRPCIWAPHVGYNVEWSQELRVPQSALEYAKAWLLVHHLAARLGIPAMTVFDLSVGYDLAGIRGEKVANFLARMRSAGPLLQRLWRELPQGSALREVQAPDELSRTLTLSTFHGCPAHEIEGIATHLMRDHGLDVVVKLNPTLLGEAAVRELLHDRLGYTEVRLDPHAFAADLEWGQLMEMVPRLRHVAAEEGVGFGVKFSNTLVCRSGEPPFPDGDMYLSGAPLHVLAATLAARFIEATGGQVPVTFSAGIDAQNFPEVVAAGIRPVTTCTDLLQGKGYPKLKNYLGNLEAHLAGAGVARLEDLPRADVGAWAERAAADPRYAAAANRKAPRKVGSQLVLLDCLTCDKCQPVCPNLALGDLALPVGTWPAGTLSWSASGWTADEGPALTIKRRHQIAVLADLCNRCGQCDPFCPEDGGPFATKPTLFLDAAAWAEHPARDGFWFDGPTLRWRRAGVEHTWTPLPDGLARWGVPGGTITFAHPLSPVATTGEGRADLRDAHLLALTYEAWRAAPGFRPPVGEFPR